MRTWMQETLVQDAKEPRAMTSPVCCHPLSKALSRYLQLFPFKCPHGTSIRAWKWTLPCPLQRASRASLLMEWHNRGEPDTQTLMCVPCLGWGASSMDW